MCALLDARVFLDAHFLFPVDEIGPQLLDLLGMDVGEVVFLFDVVGNVVELYRTAAVGEQLPITATHGSIEIFVSPVVIDGFASLQRAVSLDGRQQ